MSRGGFEGRAAFVTGGASGIGRSVAEMLIASGARVAIADIDAAKAGTAAASLGSGTLALGGDVSDEATVEAMMAATIGCFGSVDLVINCAGIPQPRGGTLRQDMVEWDRLVAVNLKAPLLVARAAGRHMLAQNRGAIVNVASGAALRAQPANNGYGTAKAGVVMLTMTLAMEWAGRGVRINCVAPGPIRTPIWDVMKAQGTGEISETLPSNPMGRFGQPREVAAAIMFLLSDEASYITGATIPVDGGWHAWGGTGDAWRPPKPKTGPA